MLRIVVIFESSPFDRKGLFNAVHNRIRHLKVAGECVVDAFCIHSRDNAFTRYVRHTPVVPKVSRTDIDGISYRMLWYDFSVIDHFTLKYLHKKPLFFSRFIRKQVDILKGYDCILAHSFTGGLFARMASSMYGVPYFMTWHGSDIHTHPWRNPLVLRETRSVMENAVCNFFVSSALLSESARISDTARKSVLYNGVAEEFRRMPEEERARLRADYGLRPGDKVVAFVGSIVAVKNVYELQPIFHKIQERSDEPLKFWMVGDGKLRAHVERMMNEDPSIDVRFWGNVPAGEMPSVMNCMDVMLLPSLNEGLPLVCAEAIRCGANAIGADVGGISEIIGSDNVVSHGEGFAGRMAQKVVEMLESRPIQQLPDHFDWNKTAAAEMDCILSALQRPE